MEDAANILMRAGSRKKVAVRQALAPDENR